MNTKMKLTVHYYDGKYYATICISGHGGRQPESSEEVFSIERDIHSMEISDLKEEGRKVARERGISFVYNIDD